MSAPSFRSAASWTVSRWRSLYQESLVLSRELGNRRGICFGLDGVALVTGAGAGGASAGTGAAKSGGGTGAGCAV